MDPHDLFGLPLERFITERTALAKELRGRGERDEAARVAALRKPSVAAWAVNQLVRTQSRDVGALFDAGDEAQRAQAELLAGRGAGAALRQALDEEREAVSRLVEAARGLLSSEGHELSPTMLERVSETLHAAALDADSRAQVADGCLQRELRHVGIGAAGLTGDARSPAPRKEATMRVDTSGLRRAEAEARRAVERATKARATAVAKRDSAAEALKQAERALAEAEQRASEAESAHRRALRELETARRG